MRRRPWPIVILAAFQIILEPFNNLFLNAWFSHAPPRVYLAYFFENRQWLTLFYLFVLPPIMGISAYAMKKWSYAVFVLGATWMLFHNFEQAREGGLPLAYAIAIYVGNVGFVSYFLLPKVNAPYMNPKMRWWESKTRFLVDWPCRVSGNSVQDTISCRVQDFSEGGVFILSSAPVAMEQVLDLRISVNSNEIISLKAKPVFTRPAQASFGYGLQFVGLDKPMSKRLAAISHKLRKNGASYRNGDHSWTTFISWAKRLVTTGKGFFPEPETASASAHDTRSSDKAKAS